MNKTPIFLCVGVVPLSIRIKRAELAGIPAGGDLADRLAGRGCSYNNDKKDCTAPALPCWLRGVGQARP